MCTKIENENTITLMRNGTNKKEYDLEDFATKSCSQNYMYVQSRACFASADQASACRGLFLGCYILAIQEDGTEPTEKK